jgi:hypothetical protein
MRITSSLFEAFLKCPMKCWLRAGNEAPPGNVYAEWVKTQNESYRVAETNRLIAETPPAGSALSPPAETLKLAKWLLASDVVVRTTGMPRGSRSEGALSSTSQPGQPSIDAGSGSLGNRTPVPSSALRMPDSILETSPTHIGAAPEPAESPPTCLLEACLHLVERRTAGVLLAGIGSAALGGELAEGVLPVLGDVAPVKAELGELGANLLGGCLGEGDPNPLANNLGERLASRPLRLNYRGVPRVGGRWRRRRREGCRRSGQAGWRSVWFVKAAPLVVLGL